MNPRHIVKMQSRLRAALLNSIVRSRVLDDLALVLKTLGAKHPIMNAVELVSTLSLQQPLTTIERQLHESLRISPLYHAIETGLADRAKLVFEQIAPFIRGRDIADIGCGDGQVTQMIYDGFSVRTRGFDVRRYPAKGVTVPIEIYDGRWIRTPPDSFDCVVMTNVLHHEELNGWLLTEVARILRLGGRAVIIETVPKDDTPEELERTFVIDYVYNRIFHAGDVPVPGTYETFEGWVPRFVQAGFKLSPLALDAMPTDLGVDQELVPDRHARYVLDKLPLGEVIWNGRLALADVPES